MFYEGLICCFQLKICYLADTGRFLPHMKAGLAVFQLTTITISVYYSGQFCLVFLLTVIMVNYGSLSYRFVAAVYII